MEQGAPEPRHRYSPGLWIWVIAFVMLLYPVFLGPALKLHRAYPQTGPVLGMIYTPLEVASEHCPPLKQSIMWYLRDVWRIQP